MPHQSSLRLIPTMSLNLCVNIKYSFWLFSTLPLQAPRWGGGRNSESESWGDFRVTCWDHSSLFLHTRDPWRGTNMANDIEMLIYFVCTVRKHFFFTSRVFPHRPQAPWWTALSCKCMVKWWMAAIGLHREAWVMEWKRWQLLEPGKWNICKIVHFFSLHFGGVIWTPLRRITWLSLSWISPIHLQIQISYVSPSQNTRMSKTLDWPHCKLTKYHKDCK